MMIYLLSKIRNLLTAHEGLGYISLGNIIGNIIGSIFWIVLAIFVTTDVYGKASYFTTVGSFATTIALVGLPIFLTTFLAKGLSETRRQVASLVPILSLAAAAGSFVIFQYLPLSILIIGVSFFSVSLADMIGQGRHKEYALANIGQKIVNIALSLVLYLTIGFDGIILGYAISYLVFSHRILSTIRFRLLSFSILKEKRKFLIDSWGLDVSKAVGFASDKFLIAPIFGFTVLGIYQLGIQFLLLQATIPNLIFSYLLREEARGINRRYVKMFGFGLTISLSFLVVIFAPYVVPALFPRFTESVPLIQIATWGAPAMTLNSIMQSELLARERSRPVLLAGALFFGIIYVSMYYLGSIVGPTGLIYGLLVALFSETAFLALYRRVYKDLN